MQGLILLFVIVLILVALRMKPNKHRKHTGHFVRLMLEQLEIRTTPTTVCSANPTYEAECDYLDALIPANVISITAQQNGNWSDPATWGGRIPGNGDNVWIPNGVTVTVDTQEPGSLRSILDNGVLQFATNVKTSLLVDTVVVGTDDNASGNPEGVFTMGTPSAPIQPGVTATLTFADDGPLSQTFPNDYDQLSRGFISMNTASFYGATVTPYVQMANVSSGSTTLQLGQVPVNWNVGDTLLIPGTSASQDQDEQIAIAAISGTRVTLETPLTYSHTGQAGYVADEVRNVIVQSQNTTDYTRFGQVMFMHTDQETVAYTDFLNLGRTNKALPLNNGANGVAGTNQVGRYAVHFHRDYWPTLSENDPPILVLGNFESGSPGWGYDNHSSNVDMEYNVAFQNNGAGFVTEAGNEIGTFNGNLAVRSTDAVSGSGTDYFVNSARNAINDFGFTGAGFWMQSPSCVMTNNIAIDDTTGFAYYNATLTAAGLGQIQSWGPNAVVNGALTPTYIDTLAVPVPLFSGNSAAQSMNGVEFFWHLPVNVPLPAGTETTVEDFTAWNVTDGVDIGQWAAHITVQDSTLTANPSAPGTGVHGVVGGYAAAIQVNNSTVTGFNLGFDTPDRESGGVNGGHWDNTTNFEITQQLSVLDSNRQLSIVNPAFGPHSQTDYQMDSQTTEEYVDPNSDFVPQETYIGGQQLYFLNQAAAYVPFPYQTATEPSAFVGLTNQQLMQTYGLAMEGMIASANAISNGFGLIGSSQAIPIYYALNGYVSQPLVTRPTYTLSYYTPTRTVTESPITLTPGWNILTRTVNGSLHSWIVEYTPPAAPPTMASIVISGLTSTQTAGTPYSLVVSAIGSNNAPFASYTGTIHFTSSDLHAVLPANYTFTAADGGTHTFHVTFNSIGNQSLNVTDGTFGTNAAVQVAQATSVGWTVSSYQVINGQRATLPLSITASTPSLGIQAVSSSGATVEVITITNGTVTYLVVIEGDGLYIEKQGGIGQPWSVLKTLVMRAAPTYAIGISLGATFNVNINGVQYL